ncbi:type IV toxin-antitoxin system AbiEi family antitoxin domain-containing protein [Nocardioides sp.]|uniref:type IV toxin-antitoxin system AbiEi family antitoxin domain-containing protein n=1 Tax=Nocardioides sp. TaxID=35761 RepID=UPI0026062870|nr:type IV toxin-antitoxin system AbiEi family antitoxin domain-containing protein [Nocardioides sp.]
MPTSRTTPGPTTPRPTAVATLPRPPGAPTPAGPAARRPPAVPDPFHLARLLDHQHGVVSRTQVLGCGYPASEVRRRIRRQEWARVSDGVFINHTGPLTWIQRAWAAVLSAWPAALAGESAWRAAGGPGRFDDDAPITVAVARHRHLTPTEGVTLRRAARFPLRVVWNASPPRMRFEDVALDLAAAAATEDAAIGWLADAAQARLTTADYLLQAVRERPRLPRRRFLGAVLLDVRAGTCSVLEHGYLSRVELAHGLPTPERPTPTTPGRPGFRSLAYPAYDVLIELDGRLARSRPGDRARGPNRDRDRDLDPDHDPPVDQDLAAATAREPLTLRLGWPQVFETPCDTARKIAVVLARRGWTGVPTRCPRCG